MRYLCRVVVILCGFAVLPTWADSTQPIVRAEVTPAEVMVGESIRLRITVLVPTWFTKASVYPSFELANTITRLPPDSSFNASERIGGETWTGIVRDYRINPQIAARYEISGKSVRVTYADPNTRQPTPVDVPVPAVSFTASVPAGAEALTPFLTGTAGSIERQVDGDLDNLKLGDAIVVTVTAKLQGMPVMFLPELSPPLTAPGVESYPQEPVLRDGDVAERTEQITYVFNGGGEFALPALSLRWWDQEAQAVAEAAAPEQRFTVAGAPAAAAPTRAAAEPVLPWWVYVAGVLAAAALLYGLVLVLRPLYRLTAQYLDTRRTQTLASEGYAFRQLQDAIRNNDKQGFQRWLDEWLDRLDASPSLAELSATSGQPLQEHILEMHRAQYGKQSDGSSAALTPNVLGPLVAKARQGYLAARRQTNAQTLAPLNPTATRTR